MDQSWMNESCMSPAYEEGVEEFLQFAFERSRPDEDEILIAFSIDLQVHDMKAMKLIPWQSSMHSENN